LIKLLIKAPLKTCFRADTIMHSALTHD
jgi:hypothetical protein